MRRYWSQVAMLLLGMSLTVGFYEGRKLVKNTAKALTAASSISGSASGRRHARDEDDDDRDEADEDGDLGVASTDEGERGGKRKLGKRAFGPQFDGAPGDFRSDKI